jgi:hypothetical protein
MRSRILCAHAVEILSELCVVDSRSWPENGNGRVDLYEAMPSKRGELPDRHSISGHHEGLTLIETTHDFTALVAQLSLAYLSHPTRVAPGDTLVGSNPGEPVGAENVIHVL